MKRTFGGHNAGRRSWYNRALIRDALAQTLPLELIPIEEVVESYTTSDKHPYPLGAM